MAKAKKKATREKSELLEAVSIAAALQGHPFKIYTKSFSKHCYRIVFGGLDPLDIAGNLAAGGRFNIGGAQRPYSKQYFGLDIFSLCLWGIEFSRCQS